MKKLIYGAMTFLPALTFGATAPDVSGITGLIDGIKNILSRLIPVMFALAIVYFFWGVVQFLRSAGDPKMQEQGKSHMIYGVIAIAVMVSIYGLIAWLQGTLGVSNATTITLPTA